MERTNLNYTFNENGVNEVIDELSSTSFLALREVKWSDHEDEYRLDLRRYFVKQDGTEMPGKGTAIANPGKLTDVLVSNGYGDNDTILREMFSRDGLTSSMGRICADFNDDEYESFKEDLDSERSKAIIDKGMNAENFMESLK